MPWPLKLIGTFDHEPWYADLTPSGAREVVHDKPGDCFWHTKVPEHTLGRFYLEQWRGRRLPLFIRTPGGWWSPDQMQIGENGWYGNGWTVTGIFPLITVMPSINQTKFYHGWVKDGILSDDLEPNRPDPWADR